MKKFFIMAVAAIAAFSSCTSEFIDNGGAQTKVFKARMENVGSRVTLNGNTPAWEIGDAIDINGETFTVNKIENGVAELNGPADQVSAPYIATFQRTGTETYGKFNMPMKAESNTTELNFKNTHGVLKLAIGTEDIANVTSISVNSGSASVGSVTYKSTVTTPNDFYVAVTPGTYTNGLQISVTNGTDTKVMSTTKTGGVTVDRNNIYAIDFEENPSPLLPGNFTVALGKTVKFTKSNIYWNGSALKFEEKPTDYPTAISASHINYFYWCDNLTRSCGDNVPEDNEAYLWCDENHKISVEGENDLYVLSKDEWKNLLGISGAPNPRSNADELKKFPVTVGGVAGCFIFAPDGYDYINNPLKDSYTIAELNANGIVCLPPAGYCVQQRSIFHVNYQDVNSRYMTSSIDVSPPGGEFKFNKYCVSFGNKAISTWDPVNYVSNLLPGITIDRFYDMGYSIRLVK